MKKTAISLFLVTVMILGCVFTGCTANETTTDTKGTETMTVARDEVLNLLMVGNSFCYYYVEELYSLLMENPPEGITEVNIYNLYYSGCNLTQHLNWWQQDAANYELYKVSDQGRQKLGGDQKWTLEQALVMADWDYISCQGTPSGTTYFTGDLNETAKNVANHAEPLLDRFHELFPDAQLLWHRTWYSEIGRVSSTGYTYNEEDTSRFDAATEQICGYLCETFDQTKPYDLVVVNSGPAWTKARELNKTADVLPYGGLCARLGKNSFGDGRQHAGDGYHDGDIGGAQLLNAYVWYMTITGNTDISYSTYEPEYKFDGITYNLSKEHIALLKEAAMSVFTNQ